MSDIRAISIDQPWASLIAIGAKQWETRSRPLPSTITPETLVIICSTAKAPKRHWVELNTNDTSDPPWMLHDGLERFTDWFESSDGNWSCTQWQRRWLGAALAVARFTESLPIVGKPLPTGPISERLGTIETFAEYVGFSGMKPDALIRYMTSPFDGGLSVEEITSQRPYGHWTPGNWAWRIEMVSVLSEPVSVRWDGCHHQGFWRPNDATIAAVREQVTE